MYKLETFNWKVTKSENNNILLIFVQNESRRTEMLAAACAVGVAGTFGAPIGGNGHGVNEWEG